ncbi:MAG: pilus assembly protein [Thiotrichaceae bacterium]|nr:pilus assembly protein [Thiotrichaceae bacterium]
MMKLNKENNSLNRQRVNKQSGAVQFISLIMLLLLTILGVSSMKSTVFEEKMAGNYKDVNTAFQAAEVGLRGAEDYLSGLIVVSDFGLVNGLYAAADTTPTYKTSTWTNTDSVEYDTSLTEYAAQPRYFIKYVRELAPDTNAKVNLGGYGEKNAGGAVTMFKVVSRGTGGSDSTRIYLQSYYGRRF